MIWLITAMLGILIVGMYIAIETDLSLSKKASLTIRALMYPAAIFAGISIGKVYELIG